MLNFKTKIALHTPHGLCRSNPVTAKGKLVRNVFLDQSLGSSNCVRFQDAKNTLATRDECHLLCRDELQKLESNLQECLSGDVSYDHEHWSLNTEPQTHRG